jgi:uncharacterized protein YciI
MAYYAAILHMLDAERNVQVRPRHIAYLDELDREGHIYARGAFADGSGGMIVYIADSQEEAVRMAENDPHVLEKTRSLELKEWNIL